jgi:ferredoxin-like protein FixX
VRHPSPDESNRDIKIRDTKAENTIRKLIRILPTTTYNSEKTIKVKYIQYSELFS